MIVERLVPGFEIFAEQVNGIKKSLIEEPIMVELVMTPEHEEDVPAAELKATDDQEEELNFESYVLNYAFYDDIDISLANLFENDDVFFSKVNTMKSNFAYLCDVFPNGYSIYDSHFIHIFDINSMKTESFNLGTNGNLRNIWISSDLTPNKKKKIKEILIKRQRVFS